MESRKVLTREINWLPLPGVDDFSSMPQVEEDDFFSKAEIISVFPRQGKGTIKNGKNQEMEFLISDLEFVGPKNEKRYLKIGGRVGYDVARTSDGARIVKLKIY